MAVLVSQGYWRCSRGYFLLGHRLCSSISTSGLRAATVKTCCCIINVNAAADHQKLEREARICRLLKHPNIGISLRLLLVANSYTVG